MTTHIELRTESPDRTGTFRSLRWPIRPGEALVSALEELTDAFHSAQADPQFVAELDRLLRDYAGRPSPSPTHLGSPPKPAVPASCSNARISTTHRFTQDQQCAGPALLTKRLGKDQ